MEEESYPGKVFYHWRAERSKRVFFIGNCVASDNVTDMMMNERGNVERDELRKEAFTMHSDRGNVLRVAHILRDDRESS